MRDYYAPRFEVRISGLTLSADITRQVTSVSYDNNLELADMFTLSLNLAEPGLLDSAVFDLGKTIEIHLGYGRELHPMMLGEITAISPSFPQGGSPSVSITGYDKSHRLRHNQPDREAWQNCTDSTIAAQIALEAGLIPIVDPSPFFHDEDDPLPQTGSDFALLKERAEANYFEVFVNWDRLYFRFPRPQTEAFVLEWGRSLSSFTPRLSNAEQVGLQVIRGYNEQLAQTVIGVATGLDLNPENIVEKLGTSALEALMSLGRRVISDQRIKSPIDALAVAKSMLQQVLEGMFEASGSCIGIPELRAGEMVSIRGVGKKFSGKYRLSRVTHTIDGSGYRTSFEVTQKSHASLFRLFKKEEKESPPSKGQRSYSGVYVAKVSNNVDKKGLGRIKLKFPWLSEKQESPPARCITPMAGRNRGIYFLPEKDEEVVVAFLGGDFEKPVVLGSVWNGPNPPPLGNLDGTNAIRTIRTGAGHEITFDDTEKKERILIKDKGGSEIILEQDGTVRVKAAKDLKLEAAGDIEMRAKNVNVVLPTGGKMDVS